MDVSPNQHNQYDIVRSEIFRREVASRVLRYIQEMDRREIRTSRREKEIVDNVSAILENVQENYLMGTGGLSEFIAEQCVMMGFCIKKGPDLPAIQVVQPQLKEWLSDQILKWRTRNSNPS